MTEEFRPLTEDPPEPPPPPPPPRSRSVRRPAKGRQSTGPRTASKARKRPVASPTPSPAETVRGLFQLPATGFVMVGQRTGSIPLQADGATILVHGGTLADAIGEWAEHDPRVMAGIEKLIMFGPASAVVMALVIMGAQMTRNHREDLASLLSGFGAVPPLEIIAAAGLPVPEPVASNGQRSGNVSAPTE